MLADDIERHAALLEALAPSIVRLELTSEHLIEALCATLRRAWHVARPAGLTVGPAQEKAGALGERVSRLWEDLGRSCSAKAVDRALECAQRRAAAFDLDRCLVTHGDPQRVAGVRVVSRRPGAESGFVFVDPDGFLADPAYDLGGVLRDWCAALLTGDALAWPATTARCWPLGPVWRRPRSGNGASSSWCPPVSLRWSSAQRVSAGHSSPLRSCSPNADLPLWGR